MRVAVDLEVITHLFLNFLLLLRRITKIDFREDRLLLGGSKDPFSLIGSCRNDRISFGFIFLRNRQTWLNFEDVVADCYICVSLVYFFDRYLLS